MKYEIKTKNDISGAMLTVRFPETELDQKALYTLQADLPDFLLPFSYRSVDGQAECTYHIGNCFNLKYRYGEKSRKEYVEFWNKILTPLLDCSDWFLKPYSFVIDTDYLFMDKSNQTVKYLYIPSKEDCVDYGALKDFAAKLSNENTVTDPQLENKVLKAIMQDFNPKEFLSMLQSSQRSAEPQLAPQPQPTHEPPKPVNRPAPQPVSIPVAEKAQSPAPVDVPVPEVKLSDNDIIIDLNGGGAKAEKEAKKKKADTEKPKKEKSLFGGKGEQKKDQKQKSGLFGHSKKKQPDEIIAGAAMYEQPSVQRSVPESAPAYQAPVYQTPVFEPSEENDDVTQLDESDGKVCLRLVSAVPLPPEIIVDISEGTAFTIGRFDVSVGKKQSSFEFPANTVAVSRRHAVIERHSGDDYILIDLSSRAGTYIDGKKLIPNVPEHLESGNRVSFGTSGADYIWEQ